MGEENEIILRRNFCAYLTDRLMGDPNITNITPIDYSPGSAIA